MESLFLPSKSSFFLGGLSPALFLRERQILWLSEDRHSPSDPPGKECVTEGASGEDSAPGREGRVTRTSGSQVPWNYCQRCMACSSNTVGRESTTLRWRYLYLVLSSTADDKGVRPCTSVTVVILELRN
jgi:hypothetical protein